MALWVWVLMIKFMRIFVFGDKESNSENCQQRDKNHPPGPFSVFTRSIREYPGCGGLCGHWLRVG